MQRVPHRRRRRRRRRWEPFLVLLDAGRVINELTGFPPVGKYAGKSLRRIWISGREANDLLPLSLSLSLPLSLPFAAFLSFTTRSFRVPCRCMRAPRRAAPERSPVCTRARPIDCLEKVVCEKFSRSLDMGRGNLAPTTERFRGSFGNTTAWKKRFDGCWVDWPQKWRSTFFFLSKISRSEDFVIDRRRWEKMGDKRRRGLLIDN